MKHETLIEAQLAVMADVQSVDYAQAPGLRYKYMSHANLVAALRPAMITHGIAFALWRTELVDSSTYTTDRGTQMVSRIIKCIFTFTLAGGTDEDIETVEVMAEAADSSDKATSKAITQAAKYALRMFFMIECDDDDPDHERHERQAVASGLVARVMTALNKATTTEDVHTIVEKALDPSRYSFTPQQQEQVKAAALDRTLKLAATATTTEGDSGTQEPAPPA